MFNPLTLFTSGALKGIASSVKGSIASIQQTKQVQVTSKADVLIADAKGDSWMQRTWRPFLGYTLSLIIFIELLVVRVINIVLTLIGADIRIDYRTIPAEVWTATLVVAGVFGGGRTVNKILQGRKQDAKIKRKSNKRKNK